MISLLMLGVDHQLPDAQHAGGRGADGAAETCRSPTQQYSWILGAFQGAIMLQPLCGYVLDVVGLKSGLRCLRSPGRSSAWRTAWRTAGRRSFWLRGLLGFAEGSANPAGMKATSEWFPAQERGLAGGVFNIGRVGRARCSRRRWWPGPSSSYNWQAAFVHHRRSRAGVGRALARCSISRRRSIRALSDDRARLHRAQGRSSTSRATARARRSARSLGSEISGASRCRVSWPTHLGHADVLAAALSHHRAALRSEADRAVRLAAVPGGGSRLSVRRHDQHGAAETVRRRV